MQLTLWTYEGPPHVGAMRIATAMKDVHYVLHGGGAGRGVYRRVATPRRQRTSTS